MAARDSYPAMSTVLAIPELLETILVHLDLTTLLVSACRVSKTWHDLIAASPAIQRALFFRPAEASPSETRPTLNPLLVKKFGPCFFDFGETYGFYRHAESFYSLPWTPTCSKAPIKVGPLTKNAPRPDTDAQTAQREKEDRRRFTRRGASWRRMLVSQPPPLQLGYIFMGLFDSKRYKKEDRRMLMNSLITPDTHGGSHGLRMGDLYDVVQHHAGHHSRHSLWFRVVWDQPQEPFQWPLVRETSLELMARTNVLVEFTHVDDENMIHRRDPANVSVFDGCFRCDEQQRPKIMVSEIRRGSHVISGVGVNFVSAVW